MVRRADRIDLPSDRYYRREDSEGLSISVNQRKIILLVFEFSGFSHSLGQNPPHAKSTVGQLPPVCGHAAVLALVRVVPILLQKSQIAWSQISCCKKIVPTTANRCGPNHVTEVASEFVFRQ